MSTPFLVKDIFPGSPGSLGLLTQMTTVGNTLFFTAAILILKRFCVVSAI